MVTVAGCALLDDETVIGNAIDPPSLTVRAFAPTVRVGGTPLPAPVALPAAPIARLPLEPWAPESVPFMRSVWCQRVFRTEATESDGIDGVVSVKACGWRSAEWSKCGDEECSNVQSECPK